MPQLCYFMRICVSTFFCLLPVFLFVCLSSCLFVCLSVVCHSNSTSACLYLFACFVSCLSVLLFIRKSVNIFICQSLICPSVSVWLSVLPIPDFNPFVPNVFSLIWSKISWGWILCDPTMPRDLRKRSQYFFLYKYVTKKVSLHRNFLILNSLFTENHLRK